MNIEAVRTRYFDTIRRGDRREAFRVVDEARTGGLGIRELYEDVFQPAQREIGRLWQENRITVADEHLATAITQAAMTRVYDDLFSIPRRDGLTLIAACADSERHEIGLRMICDLMEAEGWDTIFLGATVPVESLVAVVQERKPRAVALSAALTPHLARVQAAIRSMRDRMGSDTPFIIVGGRAFSEDPALARRIGADAYAATAADAARAIEEST